MGYLGRSALLMLARPLEGLDRIRNRLENAGQALSGRGREPSETGPPPDPRWLPSLHEAIRVPVPCPLEDEFGQRWAGLHRTLAGAGLPVGEGHDADRALARAVWCLVRHLAPARVVETGVARGVTSSFVLAALAANRRGHLWSIDLPPMAPAWHAQPGIAVPEDLRGRWTYLRGSSRRRLPALLRSLPPIDLFIHDSLHTDATVGFELERAWAALEPRGAIVVDDVDTNRAFQGFAARRPEARAIIAAHAEKGGRFGLLVRTSAGGR